MYTKIVYPVGKTLYRCEGPGPEWLYYGTNNVWNQELLSIYDGYSMDTWNNTPVIDWTTVILPIIIPAPGGVPVFA